MCLIIFSYKEHPRYELIFAANRDEFYDRPTRAAQFWQTHPDLLAGKDLKAGGTWMGITKSGAISALTNYRDLTVGKSHPPSRGHLVLDFLINKQNPQTYLETVDQKADQYDGFNILAGTLNHLMYYSNKEKTIRKLNSGLYGLSNHLLNTPWKKVEKAKKGLQKLMGQKTISADKLFEILIDDAVISDNELPKTGLPLELERAVSSIFIKTDRYGTRCSTVLLVDKKGKAFFEERQFKKGTMKINEVNRYQFTIAS